jgi:uncharacterized protein YjbI with pentapeptide repeats
MRVSDWQKWAGGHTTNLLRLAIVVLFLLLAVWAITLNRYGLVIANREPWLWLTVALVSVGPELAGIVIGVVTIDYLNERRQLEQLKAQLIRQMGTNVRDVAVAAVGELAHHGWAYDGSLSGAYLVGADLRTARLERAVLSRANLERAALSDTVLRNVDLSDASLRDADLTIADLAGADLIGTNLYEANLGGANLSGVDLTGADLRGANLVLANLRGARMFETWLAHANLTQADLGAAFLMRAELGHAILTGASLAGALATGAFFTGAYLNEVHLEGAYLSGAYLDRVKNWTIDQLVQAADLSGTTMPDGVRLWHHEHPEEPTFEAWKARYLAKYGGADDTLRDIRVIGEPPSDESDELPPLRI